MSLLEDALRRQAQQSGAADAAAPGDGRRPSPSGMPRATGTDHGGTSPDHAPAATPSPDHAPAATPAPGAADVGAVPAPSHANARHPAQLVLPVAILLLALALAWLALRQGRLPASHASESAHDAAPTFRSLPDAPRRLPTPPPPPSSEGNAARPTEPPPVPAPDAPRGADAAPPVSNGVPDALFPPPAAGAQDTAMPPESTNGHAAALLETPPAGTWPLFTVRGLATSGQETLVMLDTGEMLATGERSKNGVRVLRVTPLRAWFEWNGQTNGLRKGESSDRPLLE